MPHSYICCLIHVVFATSERRKAITPELQERLHNYLAGVARGIGMEPLIIGGTSDHVHLLLSLPKTIAVGKAVQVLKAMSSKWVHENFASSRNFAWQEGYGAFSIGLSQRDRVVRYIQNQEEHHRRMDFAEEFRKLLAAYEVEERSVPQRQT